MTHSTSSFTTESRWYWGVLLILIAWSTYLNVPLVSGGRLLVPSFPTVALTPFLFLAVRRNVSTPDVVFLLKMAFLLLLSIALSPGYGYIQEKFLALVQFLMALGVAVLTVRLMQQLSRMAVERALLILWCLILIGVLLELFEVTRAPSDLFREWAYRETYGLYDADSRDVTLVGWTRPKLFSEEPSHVTKFFIASINAWLLVRVTGRKALVVAGATAAMVVIMGSPMLLASAALTVSILIWNQRIRLGARVITVTGILLIGAVVGTYFAAETYSNVVARVTTIDQSSADSTDDFGGDERRVVLPWVTLADVWRRWPIFGVGIGGKEVVAELKNMPGVSGTHLVGNNAFASIGIFLGILGGAVFIVLGLNQARQSGVRRLGLFGVMVFLFSFLIGGFDSFRYWGFIALLWGALAVADGAPDPGMGTSSSGN